MNDFFAELGRTRVFAEAYTPTPQAETRAEQRSAAKEPFLDGN